MTDRLALAAQVRRTKPRVLIVSHTYVAPINHAKLEALAALVPLAVVIPDRWRDVLFQFGGEVGGSSTYVAYQLPIRLDGRIMLHTYRLRDLGRIVARERPDLVYVEEEPGSLVLAEFAWLKRRYGFRLVFFTWENIVQRAGLPGLARLNLGACDGAIAGNREAAEVLAQRGFRGPTIVIPQLGLDPLLFRPCDASELRRSCGLKGLAVGYIGRLVEEKGLITLLEAVSGLEGVDLLLVGDGPLRSEIVGQIPGRGLTGRVHWAGTVPHEQIVPYLNALDALVLPSRTTPTWKEQFGHVLIEAMACGVPVIGSDSGAIPEVVGDAGLIFPEGDAESLRAAIRTLQADPLRRQALAQAGRDRVLAHYTHERIAAAEVAFFEQVLRP